MLDERGILNAILGQGLRLPPLEFKLVQLAGAFPSYGLDAMFEMHAGQKHYRLAAEIQSRPTPRLLREAAQHAQRAAAELGALPLVIAPYLSPSHVEEMERLGVSAIDLCGNGVVVVPDEVLVQRSGRPNKFRGMEPLRSAYNGNSSLVARAFALQPAFDRVTHVHRFIANRGGRITLATVSKALKRLEEDLIIDRAQGTLRLVQPEKLLDKLRDAYRPPKARATLAIKPTSPELAVTDTLFMATQRTGTRLAPTGVSSASQYSVFAREPVSSFYCSASPSDLLRAASLDPSPATRFATLELIETDDDRVYFDVRNESGRIASSPVQAWLELATGDKRTREASEQVRARLLNSLKVTSTEVQDVQ